MTEFVVTTTKETPKDLVICELMATITADGVEIWAKSPIIADFVASRATSTVDGGEFVKEWKDKVFMNLPARTYTEFGGSISPDLFTSVLQRSNPGDDMYARREMCPNICWLRMKGLEEGVKLTFHQPAHYPADLVEYLNRAQEKVQQIYMKFVRKSSARSSLVERRG